MLAPDKDGLWHAAAVIKAPSATDLSKKVAVQFTQSGRRVLVSRAHVVPLETLHGERAKQPPPPAAAAAAADPAAVKHEAEVYDGSTARTLGGGGSSGDAIYGEDKSKTESEIGTAEPTTWTIFQQDGPNHLGL